MFGGSFWVVCGSLGCIIASFVWSVWIYPRWKGVDWSLSRLNQFTIGVFLAAVVLFLPMSRPEGVTGGTFVDASLTLLGSIRSRRTRAFYLRSSLYTERSLGYLLRH